MITAKRDIYEFGQELLVVCPQCAKKATLTNRGSAAQPDIIVACPHCEFMQMWQQTYNQIRLMTSWQWIGDDPGMRVGIPAPTGYRGSPVFIWLENSPDTAHKSEGLALRLWLQIVCGEKTLWFFNNHHLKVTENKWRRTRKEAKRDSILNCIKELRLTHC